MRRTGPRRWRSGAGRGTRNWSASGSANSSAADGFDVLGTGDRVFLRLLLPAGAGDGLHHRHHAAELLLLGDVGRAGAGGLGAHVEDIASLRDPVPLPATGTDTVLPG